MLDQNDREEALAVRRKVLGSEYVDGGIARSTPFDRPMQEFVIEHCWGSVWRRPGLDHKTRSLLNIAMLSANGHERELRLHVAGALRNGCTEEEIQEVLLQVGVYCGVPTAVSAFAIARESIEAYRRAEADRNRVAR